MNYLFQNNKPNPIQLPDKNGNMVTFGKFQKRVLDEFFKRYAPKYLNVIKMVEESAIKVVRPSTRNINKMPNVERRSSTPKREVVRKNYRVKQRKLKDVASAVSNKKHVIKNGKNVVGRPRAITREEATKFSVARVNENAVPISNNIGVGILSFNRLESLMCLIESIRKHTDLKRTTVFVSDESTDEKVWDWLKKQKDIVAFHNDRKGIAVNSNRLLRCLSRFKFKMILNDDVEVLRDGWDSFYFDNMANGIKHFIYYQEGVYGAKRPSPINGLLRINDKPHGAVMAIHDDAFREVGFFDEKFGFYGFEHVDYSDRINKNIHNNNHSYDVAGSDKYFRIYDDKTSDPNKHENYKRAKEYYNSIEKENRKWVDASDNSKVDGVSVIIPFRDIGRAKCVEAVVNNIRSQRYPEIQIVLVEQDRSKKIHDIPCVEYKLVKNDSHFCKSIAFNKGVYDSKFDKVVLHDADMIVRSDYVKIISELLNSHDSVHIGKTVCYMDKESTDNIVSSSRIDSSNIKSERIVNYYEGGSLAINRRSYYNIGGFCEDFVGYGCEDTEFYNRMVKGTNSYVVRSIDLFHLWHGRNDGWEECHERNKLIQESLFKSPIKMVMDNLRMHLDRKYGKWL